MRLCLYLFPLFFFSLFPDTLGVSQAPVDNFSCSSFSLFLYSCDVIRWYDTVTFPFFSSWTQFVGGRPEKRWEAFPPRDRRQSGRKRALIIEIAYTRVPKKYSTCSSSSSNLVYRYITIANRSEGEGGGGLECDGPAKRTYKKKKKQI